MHAATGMLVGTAWLSAPSPLLAFLTRLCRALFPFVQVMYMSVIAFVWLLNRRNMLDAHLVAPIFAFCALFVLMPSIVRYARRSRRALTP